MKFLAFLVISLWSIPILACGTQSGDVLDAGDGRELSYRFIPDDFVVGEHFSIEVVLCKNREPIENEVVKVDARMPAHGHGMNYRPTLSSPAPGKYVARGLLLHMPGDWEFILDIGSGESRHRLLVDYSI